MKKIGITSQSLRWLFAEMSVVVLGILLAFQIQEFGTSLSENQLEKDILQNIVSDIEVDLFNFRSYLETTQESAQSSVLFREYLEIEINREEEKLLQLWVTTRNLWSWRRTSPSYFSWRESGRPDLVSDDNLRSQLFLYHEQLLTFLNEKTIGMQADRDEFVQASYDDFQFPLVEDAESGDLRRDPRAIQPLENIPRNKDFIRRLNTLGSNNNVIAILLEDTVIPASNELRQQIIQHVASL